MDMQMSIKSKYLVNSGHSRPVDISGLIMPVERRNSFTLCQKCDILFLTSKRVKYD